FRIVGEDEADPAHGTLSHASPLARGLMGKRLGDVVTAGTTGAAIVENSCKGPPPRSSVEGKNPLSRAPRGARERPRTGNIGRLDQPRMGNRDRVERAFELLLPERQEFLELRKVGAEVIVLPDVGL